MKRKDHGTIRLASVLAAFTLAVPAASLAQTMTITPTKGQSAQQVELDKSECTGIAQQSAASSAPPPAQPERGGRLKGAAVGAAVGAGGANRRGGDAYDRAGDTAQDAYREDQAKKGAAAGVVVGGVNQRRDNRQAGAQQQAAGQQATDSAYRSCLMSRGYNVQ
jgi:hypothetical protein